mgnify:CR=1 FL=1
MSFNKIAILDKDGTLVRPKSGAEFVQNPEDQELLPGVEEAVARLVEENCRLAIASNQGGVAAGRKSLLDAVSEMRYCMELFPYQPDFGDKLPLIDSAYFCPDFEGKQLYCAEFDFDGFFEFEALHEQLFRIYPLKECRKPGAGMIKEIISRHGLDKRDYERVVMIGDRPEDQGAAEAAGIRFVDAAEWRAGRVQI